MPQPPREHPRPWTVQENAEAFRILDAGGNLLAEIPFATGLSREISKDAARQMADRMLQAGEVLTIREPPVPPGEHTG